MSLCGSNTSSTTSGPPKEIIDAFMKVLSQATGVAGQPLQQYAGPLVAGLSGTQQRGIQNINDAEGAQTPYINSAAEHYGDATAPITTAAPGIAAGAGATANGAASGAAGAANTTAANAGAAATGIAGQGAAAAGTQAEQGINLARTGAVDAAARANAAAGTDVAASLPSFQSGIAQYMNPYQGQVVDATQALFNNQNAMDDERLKGNAISQGAWGGDRAGVAQGIAAGQRALSQNSAIANLMNQGFQQGTSEFNTQQALQAGLGQTRANLMASTALGGGNLLSSTGTATGGLGANTALSGASLGANTALGAGTLGANTALGGGNLQASTALGAGNLGVNAAGQQVQADQLNRSNAMAAGQGIAGLGTQAQTAALTGANAQLGAGNLEQAVDQAQLNVPYQQFLQQQQYPFQTTQWLASLLSGIAGGSGGTSTTTGPSPSALSSIGGLGLGAYALLSDERAKEGIEHVGSLKDGQKIYRYNYKGDPTTRIGLLAQEVEKRHPDAVGETGEGIKAVDYDKATEASVHRARGGGIMSGVPDLDLSYIPTLKMQAGGNGIPRAPGIAPPADHMTSALSSLDQFDRIRRLLGKKGAAHVDPAATDIDDPSEFNLGDAAGIGAPRSTGGYVGDDLGFGPGIIGGRGISIPRLAARPRTPYVIPESLTRPFSSRAADENGKSLLPSTTYIPPIAPWTTPKPKDEEKKVVIVDGGGIGGNGGSDGGGSDGGGGHGGRDRGGPPGDVDPGAYSGGREGDMKRGGRVRRDEGGIVPADDDDDVDAAYSMGDDDDGPMGIMPPGIANEYRRAPQAAAPADGADPDGIVVGGAAKKPFLDYDHTGPDDVPAPDGIAPAAEGRYASRYKPRVAKDTTEADEADAKKMGLLAAAAGMLSNRSPFLANGIGAGVSQGVQAYVGLKEKSKDRNTRAAELADTQNYRADNLRLNGLKAEDAAKRFGDQIEARRKDIEQRGKHMENQDATAGERIKLEGKRLEELARHHGALEDQGNKGNWEYIGTDPKAEDPAKSGVYHDKKSNEIKYGAPVEKPSMAGSAVQNDETLRSMAEQYVAGDKSVTLGLGRDKKMLTAFRDKVLEVQKERGMSGRDQAATMADFAGAMAGSRALGTSAAKMDMMAVEAKQFAENALKASDSYPRGRWVPVNKALNFFNTNSGDPNIRSFGAYNNSLINAYSNVVGRGSATVSDRDHARELLSTADSPAAYRAVVKTMLTEIEAALKSPDVAQARIRERVSGTPAREAAPAAHTAGGDMPTFRTPEEAKASGLAKGSGFYTGRTLPSGTPEIKYMP